MPISRVTAYAEVSATVRALYGQLLDPEVLRGLAQLQDFNALISQLMRTAYGPHLRLPRPQLTPRRTVYQLRLRLAEVYDKLIRRTPEPGHTLLIELWRLYEVDNLKATLRGIEHGASWEQVNLLLSPTPHSVTLTPDRLRRMLRAGDILHAVEHTRDTPYYATLIYASERYERERTLYPLEIALDLDYRRRLWQRIDALDGEDHRQAQSLLGVQLDSDNLLWALRFRAYHRFSSEEIINYTLPLGYQVTDAHVRAIAAGENIAGIIRRIYPKIAAFNELETERRGQPLPPGDWLPAVEDTLTAHVHTLCRRVFSGDSFHIGLPLALLILSEHEIRALTAIIEARASDLPLGADARPPLGGLTGFAGAA